MVLTETKFICIFPPIPSLSRLLFTEYSSNGNDFVYMIWEVWPGGGGEGVTNSTK